MPVRGDTFINITEEGVQGPFIEGLSRDLPWALIKVFLGHSICNKGKSRAPLLIFIKVFDTVGDIPGILLYITEYCPGPLY